MYCYSCLLRIVVVVLCELLLVVLCIFVVVLCLFLLVVFCLLLYLSCVHCCSFLEFIVVILCVFFVPCVHCCFYFRCQTAGYKSVFGRSCDRPPRHRFPSVSLCL